MIPVLIISHFAAFGAGAYLFYRYGKKVGQAIAGDLNSLKDAVNRAKEGDRPPHH